MLTYYVWEDGVGDFRLLENISTFEKNPVYEIVDLSGYSQMIYNDDNISWNLKGLGKKNSQWTNGALVVCTR